MGTTCSRDLRSGLLTSDYCQAIAELWSFHACWQIAPMEGIDDHSLTARCCGAKQSWAHRAAITLRHMSRQPRSKRTSVLTSKINSMQEIKVISKCEVQLNWNSRSPSRCRFTFAAFAQIQAWSHIVRLMLTSQCRSTLWSMARVFCSANRKICLEIFS